MSETESLLPKATYPASERIVQENYQHRQNRYEDDSRLSRYEPLPEDPVIIDGYGGINDQNATSIDVGEDNIGRFRVPPTYTLISCCSLIFCCWPLSWCAIYQSNKVMKSIKKGDLSIAHVHSVAARKYSTLAIIYGITLIALAVGCYFVITAVD